VADNPGTTLGDFTGIRKPIPPPPDVEALARAGRFAEILQ
jgi:hypothetical protein